MDVIQSTIDCSGTLFCLVSDTLVKSFFAGMVVFEEDLHMIFPEKAVSVNWIAAELKQLQNFVVASFSDIQKQLCILTAECDNMKMRRSKENIVVPWTHRFSGWEYVSNSDRHCK